MASRKRIEGIKSTLVVIALMGVTGCIEYKMETTLNPDGSGDRTVAVEITDAHRLHETVSRQEFLDLMSISGDRGWVQDISQSNSGDTTYVFTRETTIDDLNSWSELNDEIRIHGTRPFTADSTIGYVTLGDVQFRNEVRVRSSGGTDGSASFSFQESFFWESGIDAFLEGFAMAMEGSVRDAFPRLSDRELGAIGGVARAGLWSAIEDGVLDTTSDEEERLWGLTLDRITSLVIKTLRTKYPDVSEESLRKRLDVLSDEFEGEGDPLDRFDDLLPGFSQAGGGITYRLTMPGRVTTTNAHEKDGNTLIWEFSTDDAIAAPVVIVAESVVGGLGSP